MARKENAEENARRLREREKERMAQNGRGNVVNFAERSASPASAELEQKRAAIAALKRDFGLDHDTAELVHRYREGRYHLTEAEYVIAEEAVKRITADTVERALARRDERSPWSTGAHQLLCRGGVSAVAFSYRVVGRRRDITRHRRFAKIDTRLPPAAAPIGRRQPRPTAAALRAFIARLEQERERAPKPARRGVIPRRQQARAPLHGEPRALV
jgi:hypothetical protein